MTSFITGFFERFTQFVYYGTINGSDVGIFNKFKAIFFSSFNNLILRFSDPLVIYNVAGFRLYLPYSHKLPIYLKSYPLYNSNLTRIAKYVQQKYNDLTFIDIGANVGDSVAFLRKETHFPILCIEGDKTFFSVLGKNAKNFQDVDIVKVYLGNTSENIRAETIKNGGSAHLTKKSISHSTLQIKKLSDVLKDKPSFLHSKMIKIDTDGFDCKILEGAIDFLSVTRPVIFFEYDPFFLSQQDNDGISIFNSLQKIGYNNLIVYDNFGDFMLSTGLNNSSLLEEIHLYFSGRMGQRYCDICVFHYEDVDLFQKIRRLEIQFFRQLRC